MDHKNNELSSKALSQVSGGQKSRYYTLMLTKRMIHVVHNVPSNEVEQWMENNPELTREYYNKIMYSNE